MKKNIHFLFLLYWMSQTYPSPLAVSSGGTGVTSLTANTLICGGTTATGSLQSLASNGTTFDVLLSAGAGTLPVMGRVAVPAGGTGLTSNINTGNRIIIGNGTSAVNLIATLASTGIPFVSQGAAANPAYTTAVVAGGGTGLMSATAYAVLCGGTTSTDNLQQVSGLGTSGQVLLSAGAGALPTWGAPNPAHGGTGLTSITLYNLIIGNNTSTPTLLPPSATSGIPLVSQGAAANPAYSTAVVAGGGTGLAATTAYAVLCGGTTSTGNLQQVSGVGTSGQVLTSAGSAAVPTWNTPPTFSTATINLKVSDILTLNATPVTVVAAGGANTTVHIISCACKFTYPGTQFTAAAAQTLRLLYSSSSTIVSTVLSNAAITGTTDQYQQNAATGSSAGAIASTIENTAVVIQNPVATEITGGGADPNFIAVSIQVLYEVLTL